MEHYVPSRSRQIASPTGDVVKARVRPSEMPLNAELDLHAFQEPMAFAHFFATYRWAPLWRPVMQVIENGNEPAGRYEASLAMVYGHLANTYQVPSLKVKSLQLFQTTVGIVQRAISRSSREELPGLIRVLGVLNQYEVSFLPTGGLLFFVLIALNLVRC